MALPIVINAKCNVKVNNWPIKEFVGKNRLVLVKVLEEVKFVELII